MVPPQKQINERVAKQMIEVLEGHEIDFIIHRNISEK